MLASQLPTRAQPQGCTRHFAPCTLRYKNILYCCINNTDTKLRRSAIVTNVSPGKTESSLQNSIDTHANRSHVYGIDSTTACLPAGVRVVHVSQHPDGNLPFLLYLPDIDGDGVTSRSQWQAWAEHFDMNVLTLDANCACSFSELATAVGVWLGHELAGTAPHRPVYLLGEGFGGVLGLQLAWDCRRLVNRIVLVNPATSYLDSQLARMTTSLERVPPALLNLQLPVPPPLPFSLPPPLPVALAPLLGTSPQALLRQLVDSLGQQQPAEAVQALRRALDQVEQISSRLTPATFLHRLKMLEEGIRLVGPRLSRVPQRTMIIAGGQDLVLGSDKEAQRLVETMQRAFKVVLPDAGHALLYEPGGELLPLLDKEGFYIRRRVFSSPVRPGVDVNTFGTAGPVELPNFQEVGRYAASWTARLRELSSPVFMSTLADGTRVMGLEGLPYRKRPVGYGARSSHGKPLAEVSVGSAEGGEGHRAAGPYEAPGGEDPGEEAELGTGGAPLLFVGNHQLYAFDMAVMVEEVLNTRGILMRGLAHPGLFRQYGADDSDEQRQHRLHTPPAEETHASTSSGSNRNRDANGSDGAGDSRSIPSGGEEALNIAFMGNMFQSFGAVRVTPTAMYRLLAAGEAVLLYPGGVREGFKRRNEKYELFWPARSEFVRMAARFGATIIPVSAVGLEDSLEILLDSDDIRNSPLWGIRAREQAAAMPRARVGLAAEDAPDETFIPPVIAPAVPSRFYFLFGRPVHTSPALYKDRAACDQLYQEVRSEVDGGITYLLRKREQDPYRDFLRRYVYEQNPPFGPRRVAPTFKL